jgi:two-component system response regulator DevR
MRSPKVRTIRLLLVDDHQVVRLGLRALLSRSSHVEIVGEAATVAAALHEATRLAPDVVLLDLRLPDGSGLDLCRRLQALHPRPQLLVLTSYADDHTVLEAISAGADGYLLKEVDGDQLLRAIETVAAGQSVLDPAVTGRVLELLKGRGLGSEEKRFEKLSEQEQRVLALVAQGKTNKEIAVDLGLSDKTVKNYLSNVLEKLNFTRRSQAAAFFAQHGSP